MNFNFLSKLRFYVEHFYYRLLLIREVKIYRGSIIVAETIWFINSLFKTKFQLPRMFSRPYFETKFGKFFITPDLRSTITVSPAFERSDREFLSSMIKTDLKNKKKLLFFDIGAYFGDYAISVANEFKRFPNLEIVAIEPDSDYLSKPTFDLLEKNIRLNELNIRAIKIGIGPKNNSGKLGFKTDYLHSILGSRYLRKFDKLYIKMDIDDSVLDGIKGIMKAVNDSKETSLLIEDFVKRRETVRALKENNFAFVRKLSEYNSFWKKINEKN